MLSRTADNLYWLARYVERAEYLARILETSMRLTTLPLAYVGATNEWETAVATAGCRKSFFARYAEANEENVTEFLAFSIENPSSIRNCIEIARQNARTLRNDAYWFSRLGLYIERADNTARILDVKYHMLLPADEPVGGPLDYYQWAAILRTVSALTAYHWVYRENLKPWLVADLLILNEQMPRSLASCYENLVRFCDLIATAYGRQGLAQRQARTIRTRLQNSRMEEIFQAGLHEFITEFIADNSALGAAVNSQYLM